MYNVEEKKRKKGVTIFKITLDAFWKSVEICKSSWILFFTSIHIIITIDTGNLRERVEEKSEKILSLERESHAIERVGVSNTSLTHLFNLLNHVNQC